MVISSEIEVFHDGMCLDQVGKLAVLQKSNKRLWVEIDEMVKVKVKYTRDRYEMGNRR